jgi:hypothetical protein
MQTVRPTSDFVAIGFCQKKFYKPTIWYRAEKVMKVLISEGYVEARDFGRGKGKYDTTKKGMNMSPVDLAKIVDQVAPNLLARCK